VVKLDNDRECMCCRTYKWVVSGFTYLSSYRCPVNLLTCISTGSRWICWFV